MFVEVSVIMNLLIILIYITSPKSNFFKELGRKSKNFWKRGGNIFGVRADIFFQGTRK